MYNKIILDHFHNPRNLQEMKDATATGSGTSENCGDVMTVYLKVENKLIQKASFTTMGCGAAVAAGSVLTELLMGKTIEAANAINATHLIDQLGELPAIKLHCPQLAIEALQSALKKLN